MARILIIEDDEPLRAFFKQMLVEAGHEVTEARDGQAGIDLFRQQQADLVITDIELPRKSGLEVILELRHEFPKTWFIAITGSSGRQTTEIKFRAKIFGASHFFVKPVRVQKLLKAIDETLGGSSSPPEETY